MTDITFLCSRCGCKLSVDESAAGAAAQCPECSASTSVPTQQVASGPLSPAGGSEPSRSSGCSQYKVLSISEGVLGTIFLGQSSIPLERMEQELNRHVADGWQIVFQVIEQRRLWLFWKRDSIIITLGR